MKLFWEGFEKQASHMSALMEAGHGVTKAAPKAGRVAEWIMKNPGKTLAGAVAANTGINAGLGAATAQKGHRGRGALMGATVGGVPSAVIQHGEKLKP